MNRLAKETSPYLLQHAHNPVDWYAWKPEAFERARAEHKPILVSIGYSTCHWCHVMERESFESTSIAAYMNENFINIKVDREERPDVDHIYIEACQIISGNGGWPLNCFLLPDGRPFYAGTYFPPQPRGNMPSWLQVLQRMRYYFTEKPEMVEQQADQLMNAIKGTEKVFFSDKITAPVMGEAEDDVLRQVARKLKADFDTTDGGFGGAPKFPATISLRWLLDYGISHGDQDALDHLDLSLTALIRGGIYDQLGGGFARYATDKAWLIPHFEKMLYDNALITGLLADAYRFRPNAEYERAIRETLEFIARELTDPTGGFYAALDADSEGEEGKFYVWQQEEIEATLGAQAADFCRYYGVSQAGNWEGKNILNRSHAGLLPSGKDTEEPGWLPAARARLLAAREERVRPGLDDKIILAWNALMTTAYAKAYRALGEETYRKTARRNLDFLLEHFRQPAGQGLYHTAKVTEGAVQAQYDAFLEDYALLIEALLEVYEITFDPGLLSKAADLCELVLDQFLDTADDLFYFTSSEQSDLPLRKKELYDSAVPSGNSTMALNLQKLGILLDKPAYLELAGRMLDKMEPATGKYPSSFSRWALGLLRRNEGVAEIAVVGADAAELALRLDRRYLPGRLLMAAEIGDDRFPLLAGKGVQGGTTMIYVCRNYACRQPVATIEEALELLEP